MLLGDRIGLIQPCKQKEKTWSKDQQMGSLGNHMSFSFKLGHWIPISLILHPFFVGLNKTLLKISISLLSSWLWKVPYFIDSWNFVARKNPRKSAFSVYGIGEGGKRELRDLPKIIQLFNKEPWLSIFSYQMLTLSPVTYSHSLHRQASHATLSPVRLLLLNNLEVEHFWMPPYQAGKGLLTQWNPGTQMAASRLPLYLLISWPSQFVEQVWCHEHPCLHITLIWMTTFFLKFDWSTVALQCGLSFRCTAKCLHYKYIYIFFSDSFPFEVITKCWI